MVSYLPKLQFETTTTTTTTTTTIVEQASWVLLDFFSISGLYFGILGRDFAELCSDKMASTMGFTTKTGLPKRALEMNVCAICGNSLRLENGESIEPVFQLNCKHNYHESCIRGWTIVGKKETCPYCSEKVNLKQLFPSNPWTQQSLIWQQILNLLRYLIVWNPFIAIAVQIIIYVVDR